MAPTTRSKNQAAKARKAKANTSIMMKFSNQKLKTTKPKKISSKNISTKKMAVKKSQLKKTSIKKKVPKKISKTGKGEKIPTKPTPQKKVLQPNQKKVVKKSDPGPSKTEAKAATEDKFNLDMFITEKLGPLTMEYEKKIISDSSSSTLVDLLKFNTTLVYSFYNITDMDSRRSPSLLFNPR